jgi:hypothetical protein
MELKAFIIKDGERCKSLDALTKRLARGEVLPPQWSPRPFDIRFIDNLTHEECQAVNKRLWAREQQLGGPMVYGVKRCDDAGIQYLVRGGQQKLALSTQHPDLWLTTSRAEADAVGRDVGKDNFGWQNHLPPDISWAVYAIPKVEAAKLPCYRHYKSAWVF